MNLAIIEEAEPDSWRLRLYGGEGGEFNQSIYQGVVYATEGWKQNLRTSPWYHFNEWE